MPDQVIRRRLHTGIIARARPLLAGAPRSWQSVADRWASVLAPLAAAIALLAGVFAYSLTTEPAVEVAAETRPPLSIDQLVAPEEASSALWLTGRTEPDRDAILAAAISRD